MDTKAYLDISKASDIVNAKDRRLYRFFEMIPGIISLGTLLGVFIFSWLLPSWVAVFMICFCFYYLFRIFYFSLHQIIGYVKVRQHLKIDWLERIKHVSGKKKWKQIYHVIILPSYKEGYAIIKDSLEALLASDYPKEKLIVILAVEQRAGKEFERSAQRLVREYTGKFYALSATIHPDNIIGELGGKGSNVAWAGQEAKRVVDALHIPYEDLLISTFDIDTKIYPQYFSCLTWYYLTVPDPTRASYQPVPIYNNNIWSASFFSRVVSTSNTFWQMIQQERAEKLTTYSSHAIPAKVFFEVGYPNNVVSDDSRIFWRAYLYYQGDYRVVPMYYLVSMDAVDTPNIISTALNQYKQQKRWAWGCAEIPYVMFGFLHSPKISLGNKLSHLFTIIEGYWAWATSALLLFILGWLPLMIGGGKFNVTVLSFNLPILTGRIMTIALVGMVVSAVLSTMLAPPLPKGRSYLKKISILLQWICLPAILIIFGSIPALDAQIHLLLGRYMGFWVTEKRR